MAVVFVEYHRQHVVFAADVTQYPLFGDADAIGHVLDGNAVESAFADELHRRIQHFRTTLLRRFAGTFRSLFLCHDSESNALCVDCR